MVFGKGATSLHGRLFLFYAHQAALGKTMNARNLTFASVAIIAALSADIGYAKPQSDPDRKADATLKAMKPEEKVVLTHGIIPLPLGDTPAPTPEGAIPAAGFVPGITRLGIPNLTETDASLGISYALGLRKDGATPLPSALSQASSWNPTLVRRGGAMIGSEARAKGFNVLLAGGVNLLRDPRNGRTFEYFSEDPLLSGVLAGNAIAGVQSNHIISTIKHFALNGQETGRKFADVKISDAHARESDLLAFRIGMEIGNPGSVMCAYNGVLGEQACDSDYLLNRVLKQDWGYRGFVMSDWGAVPNVEAALNGLDQQSGEQLDKAVFFGQVLADKAKSDPRYAARLDDMNRRILRAIYDNGLDRHAVKPGGAIDFEGNADIAGEMARQGIVLLRNRGNVLPIAAGAKTILVIGGYADEGVLSGGGSSQVHTQDGPALTLPIGGGGFFANFISQQYHRSPPFAAIKRLAPNATVTYRNGFYPSEAAAQARKADVVIVFATKWSTEGLDQPDLTLPQGQDQLIDAVASANPNIIVVLETGNPVLMPWLGKTAAVLEAWYPGARGGDAIASVLFGKTNPSGRLPITFPASEADLPRAKVDGFDVFEPNLGGDPPNAAAKLSVDYDIEGSDLGYRWNARTGKKALFPFGFGLSYTSFTTQDLRTDGASASFTLINSGKRTGVTVGQLYLVSRAGMPKQRLVAFERIELAPGEKRKISVKIDQRLLADWNGGGWTIPAGDYGFALGDNAEALGPVVHVRLKQSKWNEPRLGTIAK
jgi:beta-glucosidase